MKPKDDQVTPEIAAVRLFGVLIERGPGPFWAPLYAGSIWPGRVFKSERSMASCVGRMLSRVGGYERGNDHGMACWKYVGIKRMEINIE